MTQDADVMDGTNYPKDNMLAIADDRATAERAAQALRAAGFAKARSRCCTDARHGRRFKK
jgi:hypothetical protein